MKFCVIHQQTPHNAHSPRRVVEQTTNRGIGWVNRYLDREYVRRIADTTLRTYADRKSTRLNSSHQIISYAVFCLKKKKQIKNASTDNAPSQSQPTPYVSD